jgi:putative membrane protein
LPRWCWSRCCSTSSYRYRIGSDAITVRSGLLARNRREIPFARIHNVEVRQNPLHRLFGVAELRLESAGGVRRKRKCAC